MQNKKLDTLLNNVFYNCLVHEKDLKKVLTKKKKHVI